MGTGEWVDYSACPRDARHVRLGPGPCQLCTQSSAFDRSLTRAGLLHWLVWQQHLPWPARHAPERALELNGADFAGWAAADPSGHRRYLEFLAGAAAFSVEDVRRPTRSSLLTPGEPPTTVILEPDGSATRPGLPGPDRWAVDEAGVLVLSLAGTQVRVTGRQSGLHPGRRAAPGMLGQPVFLGWWSDEPTATGVRVTAHSAAALLGAGPEVVERDLFLGDGPRTMVLGPEQRARVEVDVARRRASYRAGARRAGLDGGPVYRGTGDHADWSLVFLRPLG